MNRQIKFRVWDDQRKQFRDDSISFQTEKNNIVEVSFENGEDHFIKKDGFISYPSSQIQQFTGLHDKNGKEIFEGDIVRWGMHGGSWGHEIWNRYAEVEINPDLQFRIIHYIHSETGEKRPTDNYIFHFGKFAYTETEQFLEIIGNVFENPDLVKL